MFSLLKKLKTKIVVLLFSALLVPTFLILAQGEDSLPNNREILEKELEKLEKEISQYEAEIKKTQSEKKTLQNQIYILNNQIKKLDLQIRQNKIIVEDLKNQIEDTQASIEATAIRINQSSQALVETLREINREDQRSLLEILLAEGISDFFDNLVRLENLSERSKELLTDIKSLKKYLEDQKLALETEREEIERAVIISSLQKQKQEEKKREQEELLKITKGKEEEYLQRLSSAQKRAQEIRARILELIGIEKAPTFEEAYEIAKVIEKQTGVRPAFLLAILTQESNIGKNVGQCYLKNPQTGSGVRIKSGETISRVMNPQRDVPVFLEITKELGRDPYKTPVSCPLSFGWGGAMGPAQFIPSTWNLYKERLEKLLNRHPDPWKINDSFLAAALYLADRGAAKGNYQAEWCAALSYFSGSCSSRNQIRYKFYADSVMALAASYQKDIELLESQ